MTDDTPAWRYGQYIPIGKPRLRRLVRRQERKIIARLALAASGVALLAVFSWLSWWITSAVISALATWYVTRRSLLQQFAKAMTSMVDNAEPIDGEAAVYLFRHKIGATNDWQYRLHLDGRIFYNWLGLNLTIGAIASELRNTQAVKALRRQLRRGR